jgi:ABC-2 type transport system permease protein
VPPVLTITAKDLRQRLRDRSAVVIGLVAPLAIAAVMSLAFRGTENFHVTLAVTDADHGPAAAGLLQALHRDGLRQVLTVHQFADEAAAGAAVRARHAQAGLVIPSGFSSSVAGASPIPLGVLTSVNNGIAASVVRSIAASFVAQLDADRLSVVTALEAGAPVSQAGRLEALAGRLEIPERAVQRPPGSRPLTAISYFSPAMAIFFLFFTISFTARSFFVDRSQGMIERMRAAPIHPLEILAGKSLSVLVFGLASLLTIAGVTSVVFGAHWGSPAAVVAVCLAMVISVVCLTALVIGVSRTQRQAEGISSAVVYGLALLGGNFVFVSTTPTLMRKLALCTPNGWALRAFTDLATTGGGLRTVAVPVLAMLAFSAAVGGAATVLARRAVSG